MYDLSNLNDYEFVHTPPDFNTKTVEKLHLNRGKTTAAPGKTDTYTGQIGH